MPVEKRSSHVRRDDLTAGQKALRSLAMTVLLVTGFFLLALAYTYISSDEGSAWKRIALSAGLAACAVAAFAMTVDAVDFWLRGGRMTPFSRRMTRSLVFVCMLAALGLSLFAAGPALLLTMTPALMIYLFGVVRARAAPVRRPPSAAGRQRRGGRKRN